MQADLILVTGAAGYIGSHTVAELLRRPSGRVLAVDNFANASAQTYQRLEQLCSAEIGAQAFQQRFLRQDVDLADAAATQALLAEFAGQISGVVHFAAYKSVNESVNFPGKYYRNNLGSLLNLLEGCAAYGLSNVIFSSSCSVYGIVDWLPVDEQSPLGPAECPYAHTKQVGEEMLRAFTVANPLRALSLRYFNPVGADRTGLIGEDPINPPNNLVPVITQTAAGLRPAMTVFGTDYDTRDGSCVRDYIHVTDIAKAHLLALDYLQGVAEAQHYEVFNLGTGHGVTVLEAIEAFEQTAGQSLNYELGPRRAGDVPAIYADAAKAAKLLGWQTELGISEMMRTAWLWQQHLMQQASHQV